MNAWSQTPRQLLPDQRSSLLDGDGLMLLCLVGGLALLLVAYLVFDQIQDRRRARRWEARHRLPRDGRGRKGEPVFAGGYYSDLG